MPRWEIYAHRLPEDAEQAVRSAAARGRREPDGWEAKATLHEPSGLIDLAFGGPNVAGADDEEARETAFALTEYLLGGEALEDRVGLIDVDRRGRLFSASRGWVSLAALRERCDALIDARRDQLPDRTWAERLAGDGRERATYSAFQIEPRPPVPLTGGGEGWPRYADQFTGMTAARSVFAATRGGRSFFDALHSRHGETFAFLKLDGGFPLGGGTRDDAPADPPLPAHGDAHARGELEDRIDALLAGAGCVTGGGQGVRHVYLELALADRDAAVARLRDGFGPDLPRRSWLLFHDANLRDEWVRLHPDASPRPSPRTTSDSPESPARPDRPPCTAATCSEPPPPLPSRHRQDVERLE